MEASEHPTREPTRREILDAVLMVNGKVDQMSEALVKLEGIVEAIPPELETLVTDVGDVVTEVTGLEAEIASLKGAGNLTEAELAEKLAPIDARIEAVSTKLGTAVTSLQGALPKPPAPPAPTLAPQSVYSFSGTGEVDLAVWPLAPFKTGGEQAGRQLYYNAGDTPGAEPYTTVGVGVEGWELYTGEVLAS